MILRNLVMGLTVAVSLGLASIPVYARGGGHSAIIVSGSHSSGKSHSVGKTKSSSSKFRASHYHAKSGFRTSHKSAYAKARAFRPSAQSEHLVAAHYRRDGAFVQSHFATNADSTRNNNYSTRGNVNPHTGALGTKPRDGE